MGYSVEIFGRTIELETLPSLFSPSAPDAGTLAMLAVCGVSETDKVLDLGCGYGLVGIACAKIAREVSMCDIDPLAVETAKENTEKNGCDVAVYLSDGLADVPDSGYTLILSNPPYHTDFSVAKRFIEKSFNRLALGGRLVMVTKRRDWYRNKLISIFGGVTIVERDGYFVFTSVKKSFSRSGTKPSAQKSVNPAQK